MFDTSQTTAQHLGSRTHQCDATAHHHAPDTGHRSWVLLDGIGDHAHTAAWVLTAAPALARLATQLGDPGTAIRQIRPILHAERADLDFPANWPPDAAAIAAVLDPGGTLAIAWAGDCRAYLAKNTSARLLTTDHNKATDQRREGRSPEPDAHDHLTSSLCFSTGEIGAVTVQLPTHARRPRPWRLLLASDGAYLPHEHAGTLPAPLPTGDRRPSPSAPTPALIGPADTAARRLVELAVRSDPTGADNATALVIDITP